MNAQTLFELADYIVGPLSGHLTEIIRDGFAAAMIQRDEALRDAERDDAVTTESEGILSLIIGLLPTWADEASRSPRVPGSRQEELLRAVKAMLVARRNEDDHEGLRT